MRRWEKVLVFLLFTVYFINGVIAIPKLSITFDEGDNLSYAIRMLRGHPEKIKPFDDASTMPMLAFNALPRAFQQLKNPELKKEDNGFSDIMSGRYITLIISGLTGLFIFKWSRELYGNYAGLLSLFLFVFCPSLNANVVFVTTDSLSALFTVSTAYFFWRLIRDKSWKNILLFSICLGFAQLAKQSLTHLLILFPVLYVLFLLIERRLPRFSRTGVLKFTCVLFGILFVINAGFLFHGTGQPLSDYQFRSHLFQNVQQSLSVIDNVPLPLPEPYISGLDLTFNMDEMGTGRTETSGPVYILGESRTKSGFWYYYFVSLFFKTPLSVLLLTVLMLGLFMSIKKMKWSDEVIPAFCVCYFLVYFNFFYNSQVGLRHILMVYPLLYVMLGKVADWLFAKKIIAGCILLYSIITFYTFFPNLYAYSNEFIWKKKNAYRILGNANMDYGQGYILLNSYLKKHPGLSFPPEQPTPGDFVVNVSYFLDPMYRIKYEWIRKFEPVDAIEDCFLLFKISMEDLKKKGY